MYVDGSLNFRDIFHDYPAYIVQNYREHKSRLFYFRFSDC